MLAHNVFFTLKDYSAEAVAAMVAACKKYLSGQPGVLFFAAGSLAQDMQRPVNDLDFDVALHIVFTDKAAHDTYQKSPAHQQFIEENRSNWEEVRAFDSYVEST